MPKTRRGAPKDLMIEGIVPREQLPHPPQGYDWFLKRIKKYRYKTYRIEAPVIRYKYTKIPVRVRVYKYRVVKKKRKRYWVYKKLIRRERVYYADYKLLKRKRRFIDYQTWWILKKIPKVPLKEEWVDSSVLIRKQAIKFGVSEGELDFEKPPAYQFTEKHYLFNHFIRKLPHDIPFDFLFLYYIIRIYRTKNRRYIVSCSRLSLGEEYKLGHIVKHFIPLAIKQIRERLKKAQKGGVDIAFVGYLCFGATSLKKLEEGKR